MKKLISVFVFALFAVNFVFAQTGEPITNGTIIKMVKGKLSDDLIIDEINSSKVNFDLSEDGLKTLKAGNVSDQVLQAMRTANDKQNPAPATVTNEPAAIAAPAVKAVTQTESPAAAAAAPPSEIPAARPETDTINEDIAASDSATMTVTDEPVANAEDSITPAVAAEGVTVTQPEEEAATGTLPSKALLVETAIAEDGRLVTIEKPALTIETISYVYHLADLVSYCNKEFDSFSTFIKNWDQKLRASMEKEQLNTEAISNLEKELTDLKNASAKPFSSEIIEKKKNLVALWEKHKTIKAEMVNEGKILAEELKKVSKDTESTVDAKFKEVSKNVKNAATDPSAGETAKAFDIPTQKFNNTVTGYFAPATMMLVCYQNEIISIQNTIDAWNKKAVARIQKDAELKSTLAPLQAELAQYNATSKQEQKVKKKEISALKKQCDAIEKERKQLVKQMNTDSDKLAEELIKMKTEFQGVVRERFTDITENIEHTYQDKFNL